MDEVKNGSPHFNKLDAKADKYINFSVDGATRMQNLIDDLLAFLKSHYPSK